MPDREQIVIGTITDALSVIEDVFDVCVVKESLNEIAAFSLVRVGLKKRGNLFSVVFQRKAVAKQFLLCVRRVVIRYLAPGVKVVTA